MDKIVQKKKNEKKITKYKGTKLSKNGGNGRVVQKRKKKWIKLFKNGENGRIVHTLLINVKFDDDSCS